MIGRKTVVGWTRGYWGFTPVAVLMMTLITLSACGPGKGAKQTSIIGHDDRAWKATDFDLEATGLIDIPEGPTCNGFLFAKDRVLTTMHCVDASFDRLTDARFVTGSGKESRVAGISIMDEATDLVSLILMNDFEQYFDLSGATELATTSKVAIRVVGYAGPGHPVSTSAGVASLNRMHRLIEHTADTVRGMSGSVIAVGRKAVGIHIGTTPDCKFNYGMPVDTNLRLQTRLEEVEISFEGWGGWKPPKIKLPKLPDLSDFDPGPAIAKALSKAANKIAMAAKDNKLTTNFDNCVPMVAAGVAAYAAAEGSKGGPWGAAAGAALGAGGGVHFAQIACRAAFP